ncbi:MAG: hypothetical protein PWP04_261 [Candidatus Atribacteria bacterium]|nr:hypothetical protein [Candidatus Atribacteria bacterium]
MKLKWFGHSCFWVQSVSGKSLVFDPFDQSVGYPLPQVSAEAVVVSHDHYDHNNAKLVQGQPRIIKEVGEFELDGIKIKTFPTFHDEEQGKKRGSNLVSRVEIDSLSLIHSGDLGMIPPREVVSSWQPVDVLLVPVGGVFTIDADGAFNLVNQLQPRLVIPMHYQTHYLQFELHPVEPFLEKFERVKTLSTSQVEIDRSQLPDKTEVWVLSLD